MQDLSSAEHGKQTDISASSRDILVNNQKYFSKMKKQGTTKGWAYILLSMMLIGFALTLLGCKGKEIVTESVRTEYVDRYIHDTIRVDNLTQILDSVRESVIESRRDCVVIVKDTTGNVINTSQWHFRDTNKELSHERTKVDSTAYYRSIVDSLRRIKKDSTNNTIYIEKELSLWDRMKVKFGGLAFVIVAATIIYLTWFIKRKDRQNI